MKSFSCRYLARHSILLLVALAMLVLGLISLAGMSTSVMVVENVQGSANAINVAGSLRRLIHRAASLAAADALADAPTGMRVEQAVADFEHQFQHPALQRLLPREGLFAATWRGADATWRLELKPQFQALTGVERSREAMQVEARQVETLLLGVDAFVAQLDTLVRVLEHDTEQRIQDLRRILAGAIALTLAVIVIALLLLQRLLHRPLRGLVGAARRIAAGDFSSRVGLDGPGELGQLGAAFNLMADEIVRHYQGLEQRVADKTLELQRSNRSLALLYHAIERLYQTPIAPDAFDATLRDMDQVAGLAGSALCVDSPHDARPRVIASTLGAAPEAPQPGWACMSLRDREQQYGVLLLALPDSGELEEWQWQLVEALSRHLGMALGAAHRSEQQRLLALQEERTVIARELHDSLAQALSYMKIQVSLLQPVIGDPQRAPQAVATLADLRAGLNAAYRQLRELLVSFRLELDGEFPELLRATVDEYAARGGLQARLDSQLAGCVLSPNQEVHVLQIVREALANVVRHAAAARVWVRLYRSGSDKLAVMVEDDGVGLHGEPADTRHHHGMAIMRERARGLGGLLEIGARPGGGTRLTLCFRVGQGAGEPAGNETEEGA
jgi:two-component system nitrate/nitrite sensor histidine kinase NarX